jgi:hypothetical protein
MSWICSFAEIFNCSKGQALKRVSLNSNCSGCITFLCTFYAYIPVVTDAVGRREDIALANEAAAAQPLVLGLAVAQGRLIKRQN